MTRRGFLQQAALGVSVSALAWTAWPTWAAGSQTNLLDAGLTAYLARHVRWNAAGTTTAVDYAGVRRDRPQLQRLLAGFSRITLPEFSSWEREAREAFLVNAYNVWTLALIADAPADTGSIKDLGGFLRSPWKKSFIPFLGETRSLDDIEHSLLRGAPDFNEPRIHFAVNCASIGCPALRPEAYTAARWDTQLEDQAQRFLRDRSRNRVERGDPLKLAVSAIFKWYAADFDRAGGVSAFLSRYPDALGLSDRDRAALVRGDARLTYLDYDWTLNDRIAP